MFKKHALAVAGTLMLACSPGLAQEVDRPFFVKGGVAYIGFFESAQVWLGGGIVPGGAASVKDNWGVSLELGYFLTPDISIALAGGVPPTTTVSGAGTLAGAGPLGDVTYGPSVLWLGYHFGPQNGIRPYVGAGVSYTLIFNTRDHALQNLAVENAWGGSLVAGVDIPITERWGTFLDVKKIWTKSYATFDAMGGGRDSACLTLNPLVVSAGVSYRF